MTETRTGFPGHFQSDRQCLQVHHHRAHQLRVSPGRQVCSIPRHRYGYGHCTGQGGPGIRTFRQGEQLCPGHRIGTFYLQTIIERLGGNISVTSEVGKGTTFTFVLPLESTSKTEAEKKEEDNQETTAETHSTEQRAKMQPPEIPRRMKRSEHSLPLLPRPS